uniref:Uncharacterized protein n=1 Tax=Phaselicystis flava TaxID=525924 RepID=A0A3S7V0C0_9BACT|nr:hypothetical protein [Phaselicystis flava]
MNPTTLCALASSCLRLFCSAFAYPRAMRFRPALLLGAALASAASCAPRVDPSDAAGASSTGGAGGIGDVSSGSGGGVGGSAASGDASSGAGACGPGPSACVETAQCASPTLQCACVSGAWACTSVQTGMQVDVSLPDATPPACVACADEGLHCGGFTPCGPICHCKGGAWSCEAPAECPELTCPDDAWTLGDQACDGHVGSVCVGSGFCAPTCTCSLDPMTGAPRWSCFSPPC